MEIIIVGGGKVGEKLCEALTQENHNIIVIEQNENLLEHMINKYDISGIVGNGASIEILREAGADTADMFISVTDRDEINIIATVLAKQLGAEYTIARVRNPEYSKEASFIRNSLGVSLMINPEWETAHYISEMLKYPSTISVESFVGDRVSLIEVEVEQGSELVDLPINQVRNRYGSILVAIIDRGEEIIIPTGLDTLRAGDRIHIMGSAKDLEVFIEKTYHENSKSISSALIVGGGRIAYYLLSELTKSRMEVKVIEYKAEVAERLSYEFPTAEIIVADGTDQDILDEQQMESYDAFVSLTGIDEENLVMSLYAIHKGLKKVITKMDRKRILRLVTFKDLRRVVSPKQIISNKILQFVRTRENSKQLSSVEAMYRIVNDQVEALQFKINEHSSVCDQTIANLNTKADLLIAYIIRGEALIFPTGSDTLQVGDQVIIISKKKAIIDINDILEA